MRYDLVPFLVVLILIGGSCLVFLGVGLLVMLGPRRTGSDFSGQSGHPSWWLKALTYGLIIPFGILPKLVPMSLPLLCLPGALPWLEWKNPEMATLGWLVPLFTYPVLAYKWQKELGQAQRLGAQAAPPENPSLL